MFAFIRQVFRGFTLVTLCVILVPAAIFACVLGALIFLPLPANLPEPKSTLPSQASHIYDVNGNEIAELRKFDLNIPIQQSDLPAIMKNATVASEDKNFYKHKGIDPKGIARAFWRDFRGTSVSQGGSTITQQYVKLAYTNRERTISRKIREAILASQLDRQTNKDDILYNYLSSAYFGDGAYGIGAASEAYFQKSVKDLTPSEAATLVGVIPSPSAWSPRTNPTVAESRRQVVLKKMFEQNYIDKATYDASLAQPIWLESQGAAPGPVTLIKTPRKVDRPYPYFTDYVEKYLVANYGADTTYRGGLRVQTTLDPAQQDLAEKTVADRLKGTSAPLEMAMVSIEPQTGFVKALVGGRDFKNAQVNLALGGCPIQPKDKKVQVPADCWTQKMVTGGGLGRQPGSSFKPFVLATAYEQGISPGKIYPDPSVYAIPGCKGNNCTISNSEGESLGPISIKEAMAHSLNTVYAPLGRDVGFTNVANMAKKLGLQDAWYSSDVHTNSGTYALGVIDVGPIEMASAYGVFANRGVRLAPTPVVKVLDPANKVLEDNSAREGKRVLSEAVADNVTDALEGVITHGTAAASGNIGRPAAGKTGTTENFGDAWFVGYTPSLSTAVWMGYSDSNRRINYKGNTHIFGGTIPAQTWAAYMKTTLKDVPVTQFQDPAPITKVNANALESITTIPHIEPQSVRQPKPLSTGDFDLTSGGVSVASTTVPVGPPPTVTPID